MERCTTCIKCLFLRYGKRTKAYQLICLEMKKIIKNMHMVFFEHKTLLDDCFSGGINKATALKIDVP